jgi:hypothetical protein
MDTTQIFEFAMNWINQKNIEINLRASGPKPRSAQMHSAARRQRCSASRRRHGAGARETARSGRLTGAGTAAQRDGDGRAARRPGRRSERRGFRPRRSGRQRERRGERAGAVERSGGGHEAVGETAARARRDCRDARRLTGGARLSAIFELKFTPKENSPKQIARNWEKFQKIFWR